MDDILHKRQQVKLAYGCSPLWNEKVDKMSDGQLIAVYFRLKSNNKI